ncbi:MAG: pilus assembly protein [Proteobacteria bacterium]|nr:pilus assembly protein [Pseudomonadota bacterium]
MQSFVAARLRGWRLWRETSGQALVELAIVLPLFVMLLLFAQWLWELGQIRLKAQEAARYAAWEATAYPLHDYRTAPLLAGADGLLGMIPGIPASLPFLRFGVMAASVSLEASARYADLDSVPNATEGKRSLLMARWKTPRIIVPPSCGQAIGGALSYFGAFGDVGGEIADSALDATATASGALCGDEREEMVYGGPMANLLLNILGPAVMLLSAMTYSADLRHAADSTVAPMALGMAATMIGLTSASSALGVNAAGGAGATTFAGPPGWGFNTRGYVRAYALFEVLNPWFDVKLGGESIFPRRTLRILESHGVLADSWRLNEGGAVAHTKLRVESATDSDNLQRGLLEEAGDQLGGLAKQAYEWLQAGQSLLARGTLQPNDPGFRAQVERMYFQNDSTRSVARTFLTLMHGAFAIGGGFLGYLQGLPSVPAVDDWMKAAVVSVPYVIDAKTDKPGGGVIAVPEDFGAQLYNTAPTIGEYGATLRKRGKFFMGCPDAQQQGCTDTLVQHNPFGNYLSRD